MIRAYLFVPLFAFALTGCTKPNASFCDADGECAGGDVCDLSVNNCVPAADAGVGDVDAQAATLDAAPAACGGGTHECIESPPAPWQGPVIRFEDATGVAPPACTAGYPARIDDYGFSLVAGGDCACECEPATGLGCSAAVIVEHGGFGCSTLDPDTQTVPNGGCATINSNMQGPRYRYGEPGITGGSCADVNVDTLEVAAYQSQSRVCSGAVLDGGQCDSGNVCAPVADAPFEGKQCIFLDGVNACPTDSAYSEQHLRFGGSTDTRSCGDCTCGGPEGTCGGQVSFVDTCGSFPILIGSVGAGSCSADLGAATSVRFDAAPTGICPPSAPVTNGAAAETDPVTLCCIP